MFSSLKLWQIGVLLGIVLVVAGGTYGAVAFIGGPDNASLEADEQLIPVQLGNLINEVSVNGSIMFPNRETLVFGSPGSVAEILVEEGMRVGEGQPLATFDSETIADLNKAVAQARVSLRDAQYTLENFQKASDLEIAQAESKVSNAKLALNDASDDWDQLKNIPDEQMFQAKAKVSSAKVSLTSAQDTLAEILAQPTEQELAGLRISMEDDLYAPLLANAPWRRGGGGSGRHVG